MASLKAALDSPPEFRRVAPGGVEPPHADSKLGEPISADLGRSVISAPKSPFSAPSALFDLGLTRSVMLPLRCPTIVRLALGQPALAEKMGGQESPDNVRY